MSKETKKFSLKEESLYDLNTYIGGLEEKNKINIDIQYEIKLFICMLKSKTNSFGVYFFIASYHKQLYADIKVYNYKIKTSFLAP